MNELKEMPTLVALCNLDQNDTYLGRPYWNQEESRTLGIDPEQLLRELATLPNSPASEMAQAIAVKDVTLELVTYAGLAIIGVWNGEQILTVNWNGDQSGRTGIAIVRSRVDDSQLATAKYVWRRDGSLAGAVYDHDMTQEYRRPR